MRVWAGNTWRAVLHHIFLLLIEPPAGIGQIYHFVPGINTPGEHCEKGHSTLRLRLQGAPFLPALQVSRYFPHLYKKNHFVPLRILGYCLRIRLSTSLNQFTHPEIIIDFSVFFCIICFPTYLLGLGWKILGVKMILSTAFVSISFFIPLPCAYRVPASPRAASLPIHILAYQLQSTDHPKEPSSKYFNFSFMTFFFHDFFFSATFFFHAFFLPRISLS